MNLSGSEGGMARGRLMAPATLYKVNGIRELARWKRENFNRNYAGVSTTRKKLFLALRRLIA